MGQHFSNNLDSPVSNSFVLRNESLEEVTEHPCHETVGDGIFFLVSAFSSNFFIGCGNVIDLCSGEKVKLERTLFDQEFDISP